MTALELNIHFNEPTPGQQGYMKTFSTEFDRDRSRNMEDEGGNRFNP